MYPDRLKEKKFILASQSPRRQMLLRELGLDFTLQVKEVDESFPAELKREAIPLYLCELKANAFEGALDENTILITADTIVWINDHVLNKPADAAEAKAMLRELSGAMHEVYTGVCLKSKNKTKTFFALTKVHFRTLSDAEIDYYITTCKPFDKAGAYGAQEWIGYVGVERIEGTYFNVMGLPLYELYQELVAFTS